LQMTMLLNSSYLVNLTAAEPIHKVISEIPVKFPHLSYSREDSLTTCHLIKNIHKGATLFPTYPKFDYIFLLHSPQSDQIIEKLGELLRSNANISLIIPIELRKLKGLSQYLQS